MKKKKKKEIFPLEFLHSCLDFKDSHIMLHIHQ